jgi:hypothetical protein
MTLGEITGSSKGLPDRKIVREAQRAFCMSAEFWSRIKEGKIPYIFDRSKNNLDQVRGVLCHMDKCIRRTQGFLDCEKSNR